MKDNPQQLQLGLELGLNQPEKSEGLYRYSPEVSDEQIEAATTLIYSQMDLYLQAAAQGTDKTTLVNDGDTEKYREPLVAQEYFPLNQDLELSSLPPAVKGWLQQLFSEESLQLYNTQLPVLADVHVLEEATINDMKRNVLRNPGTNPEAYVMRDFIQKREKEIAVKKTEQQASEAKSLLQEHLSGSGIDLDVLTSAQLVELYTRIKEGAAALQEMVFFLQLATQAADLISQVAPSLRDDLIELLPTILIQGEYTAHNGKIKLNPEMKSMDSSVVPWSSFMKSWSIENASVIPRLTVDLEARSSTEAYPVWLLLMAHELIHILTIHYISKYNYDSANKPPGEVKAVDSSILVVILEAISLAGEQSLFEELQKSDLEPAEKKLLESWAEFRYAYLRFASKLWHTIREEFTGVASDKSVGAVRYREGMKLALAWKKRGWQLNDLELLIKELTEQCNQDPTIGIESLADLGGVAIQRHMAGPKKFNNLSGQSTYESVLAFLKDVKKPSSE